MRVLIFLNYYLPGYKGGGPIKTIANLVSTTSDTAEYCIVTKDRDLGSKRPYPDIVSNSWVDQGNASVFYCSSGFFGFIRGWMQLIFGDYDIIYLNSFFSPFFSFVPLLLATVKNYKVVLGPRGEFSSGALSFKSKKKAVFIRFFKFLKLQKRIVFQASSEFEANDIRNIFGEDVDIFLAGDIGRLEKSVSIAEKSNGSISLVFVSRVSPMKNLDFALESLKKVMGRVDFDIYGPLEDLAYWQRCLDIISSLPDNIKAEYRGELHPSEVLPVISQYDLFFLPTKGENYGHVIAEALCAGLPVIISDQTPWRDLEALGVGWDLPLGSDARFADVIEEALSMTTEEYAAFRERVLAWAKEKFEYPEAIEANKAMFDYALKK
ncbi:glycosyltransferase family 4 protein [Chromohalobacter israelensis]|uniref:glycosyltransferase family 4 protein n=1 Tax=Chromohalobacter israelensis TaxID=141390 RepID=UPI003AF55C94